MELPDIEWHTVDILTVQESHDVFVVNSEFLTWRLIVIN
jgi:hypothetical protein